jgi:hypothetical protein
VFAGPAGAHRRTLARATHRSRGLARGAVIGAALFGAAAVPAAATAQASAPAIERNQTGVTDVNVHGASIAANTPQGMRFEYAAGSFYTRLRHDITSAAGGFLSDGEEAWIRLSGVKFDSPSLPAYVRHLVADGWTPENDAAKTGPIVGLYYLNGRLAMKFTDYLNTDHWTEQVAFQPDLSKPYDIALRVIQSPVDGQALTEAYLAPAGGEFRLLARTTRRNRTSDRLRRWSHPLSYSSGPVDLNLQRIQTSGRSLVGATAPTPVPAPSRARAATQNRAPKVGTAAPRAGARVGARLRIRATATDDRRVAKVQFRVDGKLVGTRYRAPWVATYRGVTRGRHAVSVTAFDASGLRTTARVRVVRG